MVRGRKKETHKRKRGRPRIYIEEKKPKKIEKKRVVRIEKKPTEAPKIEEKPPEPKKVPEEKPLPTGPSWIVVKYPRCGHTIKIERGGRIRVRCPQCEGV